jgi:hypothetical protein
MISSTLFIRVVPQDRQRGYMLLVGYDAKIVQSTAIQYITLTAVTRASLNAMIEKAKISYNASDIRDVTAPGIQKQLKKLFGEVDPPKEQDNVAVG